MATSVTSSGLVAAADKVIVASSPILEQIALFSTDFSLDAAKIGSGVAVEVLSATAGDFGAANGYTVPTNNIKPTTVTLNKHKKSTFTIGDKDALENELAPVWANLAPVAGKAIAKAVVADVCGLLTTANAKAKITKAASTLADFAAIRAEVVGNDLDPADCTLLLTPEYYAKLLAVLPTNVIGDSEAIRRAVIGSFLGFKAVVEAPNIATADNCFGFVVPTGAVCVAARAIVPVKAGGNLVEFGTIQDETTGFVFGQRVVVDADQGNCSWTVDALYGVALSYAASGADNAPRYLQVVSA